MVRAPNQGADRSLLAGKKSGAQRARGSQRHAVHRWRPARSDSSVFAFAVSRSPAGACALLRACRARVLAAELVDAPGGVDDLLLTGIERMAVRAYLDLQIVPEGGARLERVATRAADGDLFVLRVNRRFHGRLGVQRGAHRLMGR